jgi:hypothetical protein
MWVPGYIKELTKAMQEVKMPAIDIAKWRVQTKVIEINQNANEVPVKAESKLCVYTGIRM